MTTALSQPYHRERVVERLAAGIVATQLSPPTRISVTAMIHPGQRQVRQALTKSRSCLPSMLAGFLLLLSSTTAVFAQTAPPGPTPCESSMRSHYEAAQRFQSAQDIHQASAEFRLFISQALQCLAADRSLVGDYAQAVPLFERALQLTPDNRSLLLDYAGAAIATNDVSTAKRLSRRAVDSNPAQCKDPACARAHLLLGRALYGTGDISAARDEFEKAVDIDPTFEHGYALGRAYLGLGDEQRAAAVFAEMQSSYGDSATIHMDFGRAYGEADFPEDAIREFKKVLVRDKSFPEAHYCLGASYLMRSGDTGFVDAEAEFHAELALHPDDSFSLSQLGYIAMNKHNLQEAETDLSRAAKQNPNNPDNFLLLGQIYADLNRPAEAEAALRSAIAVTTDPTRNHYQIRGAHYQLGHLLLQRGAVAEGKREMQITQDLVLQNRMLDEVNISGKPVTGYQFPVMPAKAPGDSKAHAAVLGFERQIAPALANAYNNLGAVAAHDANYTEALGFFQQSYAWNPAAEDLDYNWGRAAFAAKQYRQAAICLERYVTSHPDASAAREPLAISAFLTGEYAVAIKALAPLAASLDQKPLLAYAYAESLVSAGDYQSGLDRLRILENEYPDRGIYALAVGRAFATHGRFPEAEAELRKAVHLRPYDLEGKYQLAVALFALKKDGEAQDLLAQLPGPDGHPDPEDAELYHQIGKLQLAHGQAAPAVANFEAAARLKTRSSRICEDLVDAYTQQSKPTDAEREAKRCETLRSQPSAEKNGP